MIIWASIIAAWLFGLRLLIVVVATWPNRTDGYRELGVLEVVPILVLAGLAVGTFGLVLRERFGRLVLALTMLVYSVPVLFGGAWILIATLGTKLGLRGIEALLIALANFGLAAALLLDRSVDSLLKPWSRPASVTPWDEKPAEGAATERTFEESAPAKAGQKVLFPFLIMACSLGIITVVAGFLINDQPEQTQSSGEPARETASEKGLLVSKDAACRWHVADFVAPGWHSPEFDDSSWQEGKMGVGYDTDDDEEDSFAQFIGPSSDVLDRMHDQHVHAFVRIPFQVRDAAQIDLLVLRIRYDDGYVAYINGREIARGNVSDDPLWGTRASGTRDDWKAKRFKDVPVGDVDALLEGENILAIHGLNKSESSTDFLIQVELLPAYQGR